MNGSREYYAKWDNSDKERTIWFHLYMEFKTHSNTKFIIREQIGGCQRQDGWGEMEEGG